VSAEDVREALQSLRYVHDKLLTRHISRDTALAVDIRETVDRLEARLARLERVEEAAREVITGLTGKPWAMVPAQADTLVAALAATEEGAEE